MSAFVCGYVFAGARARKGDLLTALSALAPGGAVVFRPGAVQNIVGEILHQAAADMSSGGLAFLATLRGHGDNVSDALIDAGVFDPTVSLRDAVSTRLKPLTDTISAAFALGVLARMVLVVSYGFDMTYPRVLLKPDELGPAIAEAYEREGQVPSLCVVVEQATAGGTTQRA